ncbi:MAG TPA: proton-conducting transporter membrane subunit, partial [Longimicrobium sp.]|nr:proton-conducting transporter membrane subunit [Longimicrobium sp.]
FSIFLLSLAGFPLTAGFLGKLYILRAAIASGLTALAVLLVLTSLVSYFYYLRVIVVMYMTPGQVEGEHRAARLPSPAMAGVVIAALLVVGLFFAGRWPMGWAERSAGTLWQDVGAGTAGGAQPAGPVARVP